MACSRWIPAFALVALTAGLGAAGAAEDGAAAASRRAARLRRGVSLDGLFAPSDDKAHPLGVGTDARSPTTQAARDVLQDIPMIAQLGFDHVRLEFEPTELAAGEDLAQAVAQRLGRLDAVLDAARPAGLAAIVCLRLDEPGTVRLFRSRNMLRGYATLLRELAERLSRRDAEWVFLQVLGEGFIEDHDLWDLMMEMLTSQGRRGWAGGTLIVPRNACVDRRWDAVLGVMLGRQVGDANVIYDVPFHDPVLFTHQGAAGRFRYSEHLRGLPYPSSVNLLRPSLLEIHDVPARAAAQEYGVEEWNARRVREVVDRLADWSDRWKVPLRCGQVGVRREGPPKQSRAAWLADVRKAMEDRKLGWTVPWTGEFGLTDGTGRAESEALDALGLRPRTPGK